MIPMSRRPDAISSIVPTRNRTMWCRNRLAVILNSSPPSRGVHVAERTMQ